ncbi:MAG: S41 family peptidase [Elainella sp.]
MLPRLFRRRSGRLGLIALALGLLLLIAPTSLSQFSQFSPASPPPPPPSADPAVFDQVWQTVSDHFFDPNFNGVDWAAMREKYRTQAAQAQTRPELAQVINQMLAELKTSHTRLFTPEEPAYYQILGIFWPRNSELQQQLQATLPSGKPEYSGIGIFTETRPDGSFISAILDGSPAETAGLQVGDRLISVDGQPFQPIQSFLGKVNQPVMVTVQRFPRAGSQQFRVTPRLYDGTIMFLDALKASVELVEQAGHQIGYVHLWSYAGDQFQSQLETELLTGKLQEAESFVLDLREGWGGALPVYLNLYSPRNVQLTSLGRNRQSRLDSAWNKPVVMLVNQNSRSGKEILAYGFRKHKIGPVVGSKTPGAVVQGTLFPMSDGSALYLAVGDVYLDGDQRLEGVGVTPDIEVPFLLEYAQGADPQKDRAMAVALEAVQP